MEQTAPNIWYVFDIQNVNYRCNKELRKEEISNIVLKANSFFVNDEARTEILMFAKNYDGVIIIEDKEQLLIITGVYGKTPVYYYKTENRYYFFTNFADFLERVPDYSLSPDKASVWEAMFFDMGLLQRSIFNEVRMLPQGAVIRLNRKDHEIKSKIYDGISFVKKSDVDLAEAGKTSAGLLKNFFQKNNVDHVLLPLSGGIDSRLLAAACTDVFGPDKITALSFASNKRSYELKYAKSVCDILGIKDWRFHILDQKSYLYSLQTFPQRLGGNLSIVHGHLYNALLSNRSQFDGMTLVTGAFADAAAGYGAKEKTNNDKSLENSAYFNRLVKYREIFKLREIFDLIKNDFEEIFNRWLKYSSIETFDEYFYISQRQPRVLFTQSLLYQDLLPVLHPYADSEIAEYLFGLPFEIRHYKQAIRSALSYYNNRLYKLPDISSLMIRKSVKDYYRFYVQKIVNNLSLGISYLTNDLSFFFSPFQTECLDYNLRNSHREIVMGAMEKLLNLGIISPEQKSILSVKPYRQYGGGILTSIQYSSITISETYTKILKYT